MSPLVRSAVQPHLHVESGHALEVPHVGRRERESVGEGRRREPEIVGADELPCRGKVRTDLGMNSRRREVQGQDGEAVDHRLDEGGPMGSADGRVGSVYPVEELADRDDGQVERVFLASREMPLEARSPQALVSDQDRRIDQDSQGSAPA